MTTNTASLREVTIGQAIADAKRATAVKTPWSIHDAIAAGQRANAAKLDDRGPGPVTTRDYIDAYEARLARDTTRYQDVEAIVSALARIAPTLADALATAEAARGPNDMAYALGGMIAMVRRIKLETDDAVRLKAGLV